MMKARFAADGDLGPVEMSSLQPPPPKQQYAIKVKVALNTPEHEVLERARESVERQDVPQITDPKIEFLEYKYAEKEYDEFVADDVRGGIFSLYVHKYSRHRGTRRIPVAEYWSVVWEAQPELTDQD